VLAEVVDTNKTGFVIPPSDSMKLSDAIVGFYKEEKELAFVKNVEQEKTKYSWDHMVEAIEGLVNAGR
jgi:glycosyltransferase involved in cell wall biosynthesis